MTATCTPPDVLHFRGDGTATGNGRPLTLAHQHSSGRDLITLRKLADWFRVKVDTVRRWQTAGVCVPGGGVVRLRTHPTRRLAVPLYAVSRFLRSLREAGSSTPAPYGAYVIRNQHRVPVIINGLPVVSMTEERYAELIGERTIADYGEDGGMR